jgi:hypothetical protein
LKASQTTSKLDIPFSYEIAEVKFVLSKRNHLNPQGFRKELKFYQQLNIFPAMNLMIRLINYLLKCNFPLQKILIYWKYMLNNSLLSLTPSIELFLASRIKDQPVSEQIIPFLSPSIFMERFLNPKYFPSGGLTLLQDYLEDHNIPEELK